MGESAVLVHSYSFTAPITRNESHEDNTLQAFSQSISFGKFMTENLEWGKWSSFTRNKYVEEAEKYTRPGSVAQKKAFFEAHYKRIAEAKKVVTQEQPNVTSAEVLLHTLETQPLPPPPPPPQVIEQHQEVKDEEERERNCFRIDNHVVSENKLVAMDGLKDELEEKEKENELIGDGDEKEEEKKQDKELLKEDWFDGDDKEEKKQDEELLKEDLFDSDDKEEKKQGGELLKEDWFVGEEKKQRKSVTKNRPVFRLSLDEIITRKSLDEISLTEKRSKRPITRILEKNDEKPVHRQRFSFLNCFMGNVETQEHNQSRQKRKTEKKKQKMFLCFCLKPKTVRE